MPEARIVRERVRAVLAANSAMVMLYWEIGRSILESQEKEGWGAKVVDRLSQDLRRAFPDMKGLFARNLMFMKQFAAARPERAIVLRCVAQLPWRTNQALLDFLGSAEPRREAELGACTASRATVPSDDGTPSVNASAR